MHELFEEPVNGLDKSYPAFLLQVSYLVKSQSLREESRLHIEVIWLKKNYFSSPAFSQAVSLPVCERQQHLSLSGSNDKATRTFCNAPAQFY